MEMTNDAVGRWYETPRTGTSASPAAQGALDAGGAADAGLNSTVAEHMGAFFLDPSGTQRAARYYHQSMHSPYGSVAGHGKPSIYYFSMAWSLRFNVGTFFCREIQK